MSTEPISTFIFLLYITDDQDKGLFCVETEYINGRCQNIYIKIYIAFKNMLFSHSKEVFQWRDVSRNNIAPHIGSR